MNRTKKALSDAFWQLLEEKPYNKITVQNIVEYCHVNRNTFYYHFQDIPALAEYTIKDWADQVIRNHCEFGSPINCITPIAQEFIRRKSAFIHIYRSSRREAFIRYLNEISQHIVQSYIDSAVKNVNLTPEDKSMFIRYYKCTFAGVVLDWLDAGADYDLLAFCEKICASFEGSGKRAFLKQIRRNTSAKKALTSL
ncbi:MAG: TetR/AcrR family transcriptional regulator [bacterium]|nr:TetR/AcrR family transcriptional regulator [bacterium]